jgi:hypothetical protein
MIIRRRHTANYTTIGNALFEDERLAADEVGILAYLLSRPNDWEVRRPSLQRRWGIGRDAMRRIIFNLIRCGWCQPIRSRLSNGTFHVIYDILDQPGPTLSDEEVRQALSSEATEMAEPAARPAVSNEAQVSEDVPQPDTPNPYVEERVIRSPDTGYPSPADPYVAINIDIQKTESTKIDSGTRARGAFTPRSKALADAFWKALGISDPLQIPPELAGVDYRAVKWEEAGWPADLVETEARRFASDRPPKPLAYFEKVFATAFARRQAPLPVVEVPSAQQLTVTHGRSAPQSGSGNLIQAADRLLERIRSVDGTSGSADGVRGIEGAPPPRLLPKS